MAVKMAVEMAVKITELINENNFITVSEIAERIGVSLRSAERYVNKLKSEGKIQRSGSTKSGQWVIVSDKTK
jgi:ATP-dependent DNA helicase RecG